MAKCAAIGYWFLPFSFSSLGELKADAITLSKQIRKFSMAHDIRECATVHIFNKISFAIARGVGAQIVSRLPSNLIIIGIKHRHNVVRDTLVDICFKSEISAGKEVDIGLGSSPLKQTRMVDFVPGHVVIDVAHRKRVKYEGKCSNIGYGFLPFLFSSLRELEKDVVALLKRIRKFFVTSKH
ncbi:hypothetical protein Tco_0028246 [Tanacetum coccineum]